ncbi:cystathionine gamma-synthase [Cellulomonas oligotrophica]|uniref:Cystathionine gamma-synthase n=1 Tax=Cellulomonas oligotrophica TaxID=931536 RepID=A0A7Y9JZ31_9CELL|nr:cystathionine gamma-synthase [Cellulomonas oligotrophica]NYD87501.1 cystathionine gamma-synthase [Cellulomonas oligotrophica]GIG33379.1 cystathionine gamma-synthase [Cellulomonas oligotrophica]
MTTDPFDAAHDWTTAGFSTRAIHAGQDPDPRTGAVVPPIHQVSTYKQDGVGGLRDGYEYSRSGNPTRHALEEALAAVEGGAAGFAFSSGLAAEDTLLRAVLRPGDHVVVPDDAYGGTYRLIARVLGPWGIDHTPVDLSDPDAVLAAIEPGRTKAIWVETPTNPLLGIADIEAIAVHARSVGAVLVVDNTFATPYLQSPLALGADAVVHSTTKYVGGHSDVVGGAVVVADGAQLPAGLVGPTGTTALLDAVAFGQNASGAVAGPFDAWLTLRGLKTLAVRMDRHQTNAAAVAQMLVEHPGVTHVLWPGLPDHPGHEVAARQMRGFGGMVAFRTGSEESAVAVCGATRVFTLAESLGGVESLVEHPGRMTHGSVAGTALEVPADLVRLSVGIEDVEDLLADLEQALAAAGLGR